MDTQTCIGLGVGVQVSILGELAIWERPGLRVTTKVKSSALRNVVKKLIEEDIELCALPHEFPVNELTRLGMILQAGHDVALQGVRSHLQSSIGLSFYSPIPDDLVQDLQAKAKRRRFSSSVGEVYRYSIPPAIKHTSSVPHNVDQAELVPLCDEEIESLLKAWHSSNQKLYPSAGALYPIRIVIEVVSFEASTLYIFRPESGEVLKIGRDVEQSLALSLDDTLSKAPVRVWFVASLDDITLKYGLRGYRYAMLEAGAAGQSMTQILNWRGIETRPFGGFDDIKASSHLCLSGGEVPAHLVGVFPRSTKSNLDWVVGREVKYSILAGQCLHYVVSFGGVDSKGRSIYGFAVAEDPNFAELKSRAELAERIALVRCKDEIGNSNGMAAHTDWDFAARNSILELYERHCFLRVWYLKLKTRSINLPKTTAANQVAELCRMAGVNVTLKCIMDPFYEVPAVIAVAWSDDSGAILTASAAAQSEEDAVDSALKELIKTLYHRVIILGGEVFSSDPIVDSLVAPEDHELIYSNHTVLKKETSFLAETEGLCRDVKSGFFPLQSLYEVVQVNDMTSFSPDKQRWKVCRAYSDVLLALKFGELNGDDLKKACCILNVSAVNSSPHPIG
ncbi:MAG: hypothetical protein FH754_17515 [Marinobacter sp.]|nr:hypothetical protein [Marinobacter sp.]